MRNHPRIYNYHPRPKYSRRVNTITTVYWLGLLALAATAIDWSYLL